MAATGARKGSSTRIRNLQLETYSCGPNIVKQALPDAYKKASTIKIKKPGPRQTLPGNWKESEAINVNTGKKSDTPADQAEPIINPLDENTLRAFPTGRPLEDKVDTVQCKHCRRPVLRVVSATHIRECLNKKQEKLRKKKEAKDAKEAAIRKEKGEKDEDDGGKISARKSAVKGAVVDGDGAKKGKKRKIDADAEKAPNAKKKKKDEPKPKAVKQKGPVDVEKQCGVTLPNGGACARSLTCKSHSMGLKRAVPGRSLPYDMLLAQYQKKNQARQQRIAIDANAPLAEDLEPQGSIDSDEEKEAIMAALARHRPRPIAHHTFISQKQKYQYIRMKEMLRSTLGTPGGGSIFSNTSQNAENLGTTRGLSLNMMGAPGSATSDGFGQFPPPMSAGLDSSGVGQAAGSRRQSSISGLGSSAVNGGPRQIAPGQLPGPAPNGPRKGSMASVTSISAS